MYSLVFLSLSYAIRICQGLVLMFIGLLQAVTWFHLHQYTKSLSILEPLFQNIEPLDEVCIHLFLLYFVKSVLLALIRQLAIYMQTTALQICFLLLDIALACRDAVKFLVSIVCTAFKVLKYSPADLFCYWKIQPISVSCFVKFLK